MAEGELEVGFASPGDAQTIALMSRDLIEAGLRWRYRASHVADLIRDPSCVALLTREDARILGFAIMDFGETRAHLILLAVHPGHRRRGIARRMLTWLFDSAAVAGMMSIHVELRVGNASALALYTGLGFTETLRVPRYYAGREPAVRMLRMLHTPGAIAPRWQPPARI